MVLNETLPFLIETYQLVFQRFIELATAPYYFRDMIWILAPLLVSLLLMEFYFDRYKAEQLGWNTAFGNSLVLIFVSLDILRFLYNNNMFEYANLSNALAISVVFVGFALTLLTFFHIIPKELAFGLSSRLPINMISYLTIVIIYAHITIDIYTGIAALIFAIFISIALKIMSILIPESGEIPELEDVGKDVK